MRVFFGCDLLVVSIRVCIGFGCVWRVSGSRNSDAIRVCVYEMTPTHIFSQCLYGIVVVVTYGCKSGGGGGVTTITFIYFYASARVVGVAGC